MHGNTVVTPGGLKTRTFDAVVSELSDDFDIHRGEGTELGSIHFELTSEDITECTGGTRGLTVEDLSRQYQTACGPRLNYKQNLELGFLIARRSGGCTSRAARATDADTLTDQSPDG